MVRKQNTYYCLHKIIYFVTDKTIPHQPVVQYSISATTPQTTAHITYKLYNSSNIFLWLLVTIT